MNKTNADQLRSLAAKVAGIDNTLRAILLNTRYCLTTNFYQLISFIVKLPISDFLKILLTFLHNDASHWNQSR